jgi:hypothetical protein
MRVLADGVQGLEGERSPWAVVSYSCVQEQGSWEVMLIELRLMARVVEVPQGPSHSVRARQTVRIWKTLAMGGADGWEGRVTD